MRELDLMARHPCCTGSLFDSDAIFISSDFQKPSKTEAMRATCQALVKKQEKNS